MRILIDIGHPAHVHYFRNFIQKMKEKKHQVHIIARDKEVTIDLLNAYNLNYTGRGKGGKGLIGKAFYLLKANFIILKESLKFKPDIYVSFASPYAAQVSWLLRKAHVAFTDTEHAKLGNYAFMPFTSTIITPESFNGELGDKHIKFKGFMEQCYLDEKYFTSKNVNNLLHLENDEDYIILRFVSWGATHDIGHSGLDDNTKSKIIKELSKNYKIFISSEAKLPKKYEKYKINIPPQRMHDVLANAKLFIGEGATMASECAMIGTPAIYINSLNAGTLIAQEEHENIYGFRNSEGVLEKVLELLSDESIKSNFLKKKEKLFENTIDVTSFIVWFIENYPKSFEIMKGNSDYQSHFK